MYTTFVDEMIKCLLTPLTDVEARKVNSTVGVIANTKTQEMKDAKSGKKKVRILGLGSLELISFGCVLMELWGNADRAVQKPNQYWELPKPSLASKHDRSSISLF